MTVTYKKAVLSQGEPRNASVNFDTYRILQRHRAVSLQQHGFLVYISDRSNAEITTRRKGKMGTGTSAPCSATTDCISLCVCICIQHLHTVCIFITILCE